MLGFYLDNAPFLLDLSSSVRITWTNTACKFDGILGDVGMGISIPVNDNNRALLGNPERFERYGSANDMTFTGFEVRFSGKLLMAGSFVVQKANSKTYQGWLRSNVGNLGEKHREKFIADIDPFAEDITFTNKADYDPDTDHYGCPKIFNQEFFYDKSRKVTVNRLVENPDYVDLSWWEDLWSKQQPQYIDEPFETEALTEAFRISSSSFVNVLNPDNTVKTATSTVVANAVHTQPLITHVVSPMLFLNYVVKKILMDANLTVNESCLVTDDDLKKIIIYNNFDITNMGFNVDGVYIPGHWASDATIQWHAREVQTVTRNYTEPFQYKNLLPEMKLPDFILSIQNELNVCFHFRHDGKVDIIDRETILTGETIDISDYMVNQWEMGEKKDVTLKFTFEHDSDDMYFQERWEDIDKFRENEGDPVNNWDELDAIADPEIGEIRYIIAANLYVRYDFIQMEEENPTVGSVIQTEALGWQHLSLGFQNGFYNPDKEEEEEIATKFSTLIGDQTVSVQQKGNINSMQYAFQNFSPRLLFYNGNNKAKFETENLSMDWEKEGTGLLKKRWAKWARFWSQRQPVTGEANLPLNILDYMARNITKKHRSLEGEFVIEEMETEFNLNAIGTTKIKGYKI